MGYLLVILCQTIVGSSYPIAKAAIDTIPPWTLTCVTLAIASVVLLPIAAISEKTNWFRFGIKNWYKVGVQSLCACVLYTVFLFYALSHASATVSGIFNGLAPALVFIMAPFCVSERLNLKKALSILLAIAAVIIISCHSSSKGGTDITGVIFLILSASSVALFTIFSKKFSVDLPPLTSAAGVCFTGWVITLPFCAFEMITSKFDVSLFFQGGNIPATLYYALFVWALAYVLWYYGIPKVAATFGGIAQAVVPITAALSSFIFFHEKMRTANIIGLIFIVISVIISVYAESESDSSSVECNTTSLIN